MDTEYTKGFKAGMAWREAEIIKLLEERAKDFLRSEYDRWLRNEVVIFDTEGLIALIKGENKPFITAKQAEQLNNEMLEE